VLSDHLVLLQFRQAFADCRRPQHFTNHTHCEECAEHDQVLRSRDIDSLRIEHVGNPGWDPICFISPEGFAYYLPALARLALAEPIEPHSWYGAQLLFHLCYDGTRNARLLACTPGQRLVVVDFLRHVVETRSELADNHSVSDDLLQAIEIWSEAIDTAQPLRPANGG